MIPISDGTAPVKILILWFTSWHLPRLSPGSINSRIWNHHLQMGVWLFLVLPNQQRWGSALCVVQKIILFISLATEQKVLICTWLMSKNVDELHDWTSAYCDSVLAEIVVRGECCCQHWSACVFVCVCLPSVSSRCSNCSPYSYCKGEGDSAYCDCLPGYRQTQQGKCISKQPPQISSFFTI